MKKIIVTKIAKKKKDDGLFLELVGDGVVLKYREPTLGIEQYVCRLKPAHVFTPDFTKPTVDSDGDITGVDVTGVLPVGKARRSPC